MKPYPKAPKRFTNVSDSLSELGFILVADKSNNKHNGYCVLSQEGKQKFSKKYKQLKQIVEDIDNNLFVSFGETTK